MSEPTRLVASIDIGTVQSAVVVYFQQAGAEVIRTHVEGWPGQEGTVWDQKVPSVVLYDGRSQLLACGAQAVSQYQRMDEDNEWYYVEHFKMHLHPKRIVKQNHLPLKDLPPKVTITQVYSDYLRYIINHTRRHLYDYLGRDVWAEHYDKVEIILAHPNHWGKREQDILEQAAVKAGAISKGGCDTRLHFVEEAEASASFCTATKPSVASRLTLGTEFIICDAGGSTADISAYKVISTGRNTRLQEMDLPSCKYAGGVRVDENFTRHLSDKLHKGEFEDEGEIEAMLLDGLRDFQRSAKLEFLSPANVYKVQVGIRHLNDEGLRIKRGVMSIPGEDVETLFTPSVNDMIAAILDRFGPDNKVSLIILAGGFGENPYIRSRLSDIFRDMCEIVCANPTNSKAVAIGGLHLLVGETGSVLVERRNRTWKTWATDFMTHIKSLVGTGE